MSNKDFRPTVMVFRFVGRRLRGKIEIYHCDRLGKLNLFQREKINGVNSAVEILRPILQKTEDAGIVNVVADLGKGGELFPPEFGFYVFLKKEVEKRGGQIVFTNLSILTMKKIAISKLDTFFTVTKSLCEALELLSNESNCGDT